MRALLRVLFGVVILIPALVALFILFVVGQVSEYLSKFFNWISGLCLKVLNKWFEVLAD